MSNIGVNWAGTAGVPWVTQEASRHILLNTSTVSALGFPGERYATLVYLVNPADVSGGGGGSSITTVVNAEVQTSTTGANFVQLSSATCTEVVIYNLSGVDIEVRRGGSGVALKLPDKSSKLFDALTNANQLSLRRVDQSNIQVTIQYEVRS